MNGEMNHLSILIKFKMKIIQNAKGGDIIKLKYDRNYYIYVRKTNSNIMIFDVKCNCYKQIPLQTDLRILDQKTFNILLSREYIRDSVSKVLNLLYYEDHK